MEGNDRSGKDMELHDGGTVDLHPCARMAGRANKQWLQRQSLLQRLGLVGKKSVGPNCVLGATCNIFSQAFENVVRADSIFFCLYLIEQSQTQQGWESH